LPVPLTPPTLALPVPASPSSELGRSLLQATSIAKNDEEPRRARAEVLRLEFIKNRVPPG